MTSTLPDFKKANEEALLEIIKAHHHSHQNNLIHTNIANSISGIPSSGSGSGSSTGSDSLLARAEESEFHRVAEWFYLQKRDFKKVIQCRLASSEENRVTIFEYIKAMLIPSFVTSTASAQPSADQNSKKKKKESIILASGAKESVPILKKEEKEIVRQATISSLPQLIEIDHTKGKVIPTFFFALNVTTFFSVLKFPYVLFSRGTCFILFPRIKFQICYLF